MQRILDLALVRNWNLEAGMRHEQFFPQRRCSSSVGVKHVRLTLKIRLPRKLRGGSHGFREVPETTFD
jgi:hypothetical protein